MMTSAERWTANSLVIMGALLIAPTWGQRAGVYLLVMALVMTIDLNGRRRITERIADVHLH